MTVTRIALGLLAVGGPTGTHVQSQPGPPSPAVTSAAQEINLNSLA
jgi:hypothetical protein